MPALSTLISTSPSPGSGTGRSASCITSGPPNSSIWIARMGAGSLDGRLVAAPHQEPVQVSQEARLQVAAAHLRAQEAARGHALSEPVLVGRPRGRRAALDPVLAVLGPVVAAAP